MITVEGWVAVGMPVTRHPPHRPVHEELPHTAPTSGNDANTHQRIRMAHDLTYPLKRTGRACPALCPEHVLLKRIPLGQPPSLRGLRHPMSDVVRPLPRYYGAVRLPMPVRHWIRSSYFPLRPSYPLPRAGIGSPGSRARCFRTRQGLRPRGVRTCLALATCQVLLSD